MKIAVVGGGSTYTPELVSGLSRERDRIDVTELALHDIDAERRDVVGEMAARMLEKQGFGGKLVVTSDLDLALDGADFVLVQIRVGGQTARLSDETIPLACGCIGQETTGAGGLAKALRTVPVVLEIADRVRERAAADAWIVDFTNPVGIVTRALLDAGHRAVGLCNVAIGLQRAIAGMLELAPQRVVVDQVGLNHLTWVRRVLVDDDDVLPALLMSHGTELAGHVGLPRQILDELGAIPSYYLRYFYATTRFSPSRSAASPGRQPWRRSSVSCWSCIAIRSWPRSRSCSSSGAAPSTARPRQASSRRSCRDPARSTRSTSATTAPSPGSPTTTSWRYLRG